MFIVLFMFFSLMGFCFHCCDLIFIDLSLCVVVDLTGSGQIKLQQIDKFKSKRKNIYKPKKIANPEW
jgi:hypothetical protein